MATNTAGSPGQDYNKRLTHYLAKRVTYQTLNGAGTGAGTTNATVVIGYLPPKALVLRGQTHIITSFDDTNGDDLDIGVVGGDDDLFASAVDLNTGATLTTFDDLVIANQYSATARTVTCNFTTAPSGNGTTGEAVVMLEYLIEPE
jgi:hypothetical protein